MRAGRKARLARLCETLDETESQAESEEAAERSLLRFYAAACRRVREAMLRAGIDPACAKALRLAEERVAAFVDSAELQRADAEFRAGEERETAEADDMRRRLNAKLDGIGRHYAETGSLPDFEKESLMTLLGWATPPQPVSGDARDGSC